MNNNIPGLGSSNSIVITIPAGVALGTVSFDWEIFPDDNCSSGSCLNNTSDPDFPTLASRSVRHKKHTLRVDIDRIGWRARPQNLGTASYALNIAASGSRIR